MQQGDRRHRCHRRPFIQITWKGQFRRRFRLARHLPSVLCIQLLLRMLLLPPWLGRLEVWRPIDVVIGLKHATTTTIAMAVPFLPAQRHQERYHDHRLSLPVPCTPPPRRHPFWTARLE